MFGKLLKYDLRSMMKVFPLVWLAAIVLAFVNHFTLNYFTDTDMSGVLRLLGVVLPILVYVAIMVTLAVLTLLLTIRRFYSGLLKDEGYLAFTLPVKPGQLIASKALAATIITVLTGIAALVSVLLIADWKDAADFIRDMLELPFHNEFLRPHETILLELEAFILAVFVVAQSIYRIYAAIALGHLFNRHRAGWAVIMYLVINAVLTAVYIFAISAIAHGGGDWLGELLAKIAHSGNPFGFASAVLGIIWLILAVMTAVFHVIAERILSKRLNLE